MKMKMKCPPVCSLPLDTVCRSRRSLASKHCPLPLPQPARPGMGGPADDAARPSPPTTNLRECTPSDKSPSHSHPYPARVTNVMAARPPFPACGGLIGHAPPNYHLLPARPGRIARRVPSHAPMLPCTRAARATRQQPSTSPAPAQPPNTRPALLHPWILCPSLFILHHSMTNYPIQYPSPSQLHPSRVQPRCRKPACHWLRCRFVRVSGAQRQRTLMCASLHARAMASLQRSPQASPYHRHSLCTATA
jgi:hypothetical protein